MSLKLDHLFDPLWAFDETVCARCGQRERHHRAPRVRKPDTRKRGYRPSNHRPRTDRIIGVDGEGLGRRPHRYTYLAAADEQGEEWDTRAPEGGRITTEQALEFLISLPDNALCVAYAFFYDLTKMLQDLPDEALWYLLHEEKRGAVVDGQVIYRNVQWRGWRLNMMNRRFTVGRGKKTITIWDVFAFFQGKFTTALKDWDVGDPSLRADIERMKDQRSTFDEVATEDIERYCRSECVSLSSLVRRLLDAHLACGLRLKNYYGAGSTAKAILKLIDAKAFIAEPPEAMRHAIACSFFGGRFENSHHGPIDGPVYNGDISSAYPYQITRLPCLTHGRWEHVDAPSISAITAARLALVHWHTPPGSVDKDNAFGPWPMRAKTGTIAFPLTGKGGWVWQDEYLAGLRIAPAATASEAWLYHTECNCQPFASVPQYYRERVRIGKDARGIVLKLGPNAIYGSLAQSKGLAPPYQCWIWAAVITSGCRAQLLHGMCGPGNRQNSPGNSWNILMLATDGIYSKSPLTFADPVDTGTKGLVKPDGTPAGELGSWEKKVVRTGVFCARPGIYFPLNPSVEQLKEVRARGIGKKALYEKWPEVVKAWAAHERTCKLTGLQRFVGAKSAIHHSRRGYARSADYGEWVDHTIEVSFSPAPKRSGIGEDQRLNPWQHFDWESEPYTPAVKSPEALALMMSELIALEQPDSEFLDDGYRE
jgi:hypothetical protein